MKKTTKIVSLLTAATLPLSSFAAVNQGNFKANLNSIINDYAVPIFAIGMVLGIMIGLMKNWDKISDNTNTGVKKEGIMNTVYIVGYTLLAIAILYAAVKMLNGINLTI